MKYNILVLVRVSILYVSVMCVSMSCGHAQSAEECKENIALTKLQLSAALNNTDRYNELVRRLQSTLSKCEFSSTSISMPDGAETSIVEIMLLAQVDDRAVITSELLDSMSSAAAESLVVGVLSHRELEVADWVIQLVRRSSKSTILDNSLFAFAVGSRVDSVAKICYLANDLDLDAFDVARDSFSSIDKAVFQGNDDELVALLSLATRDHAVHAEVIGRAASVAERRNKAAITILNDWKKYAGVQVCE